MDGLMKPMAFLAASALLLFSCRGGRGVENPDSGFVDYIEAYSGGLVSGNSSIRIEFASTPDTSVPADGLFSFSPSIKGQARWSGSKMIEFVPDDGQLKGGREYRGKFSLDKVFGVENPALRTFEFAFRVAPRRAAVVIDNVKVLKSNPDVADVNGRLFVSEGISEEEAAGMLYAEGACGTAKVSLKQASGPGEFEFVCTPVPRGSDDSRVTVVFDGHSEGFGKPVSADVTIPASEGFRVVAAKNRDGAEPFVEVVLSQPVEPLADLTGMFGLSADGRTRVSADGNIVKVFYERRPAGDDISLTVSGLLKDWRGDRLGEDWTADFKSSELKPAVRLPYSGNILPDNSSLRLPFQAVNLKAVDVKVIEIYRDNVLHFLQDNGLDGGSELRRSGRLVYRRKLQLDTNPQTDLHQWQNFSVDLSGLMKREPGAIYRVVFSFTKEYSVYGQNSVSPSPDSGLMKLADGQMSEADEAVWDIPESYYYDNYFNWEEYDWDQRDNPLDPTYYMNSDRFPGVNLMSSNLGVIAKSAGNGKMEVHVNDILSTSPLSGVEVTAYSYQLRPLASAKTDADGRAELAYKGKAFVVTAKSGDAVSYLKVVDGQENSLSRFDVGGERVEKGLRGFVYGERGVWRPGDTMHIMLLVESPGASLPEGHPAVLEVYGPKGQLYARHVCPKSTDGFYRFDVKTSPSDPTGTYHAYAKVGGVSFHKALHIESIKPNRLKVSLELPSKVLSADSSAIFRVSSSWLTGSAASGLKAKASVRLSAMKTAFDGFRDYVFTNPGSEFKPVEKELFSTVLDSRGNAAVSVRMPAVAEAPGMLRADFVTRVEEPGGNESIISQSALCSPYSAYVGIRMPEVSEDGYLETDRDWKIKVCAVDRNGVRVAGHNLEYCIFRLDSNWWWDCSLEEAPSFMNDASTAVVDTGSFVSGAADSEIRFRVDYPDWGRFAIVVSDSDSGHKSGTVFLCDWPQWRGRADRADRTSATMLSFPLDRKEYSVGDEAVIYLPAAQDARALVSIENDSGIISSSWVQLSGSGETRFRFRVTEEMSPNCYAHVTLLNPHRRTSEGQPLRMYGVQPVPVSDPSSHLKPVVSLPQTLRPQEEFEIRVREETGRPMSYTLAIVDEGLLGLTGFRTPDPWAAMNRRTALGVKTWDLYDNVVGAYGTSFASMFSIGGDEDMRIDGTVRDNRFEPVVEFLGPFTLKKGEAVHKVTLPMYVGSVRVMLAAAHDGAFGSAEKAVPVRSPLMLLPTLPRTLACGETVTMPVNVFAMDGDVRDVELSVTAEGPLKLHGSNSQTLKFNASGDRLSSFELVSGSETGMAKVRVKAKSGGFTAEETVNIEVRNVNPYVLSVERRILKPGESCSFDCSGSSGNVEVSSFPSVDINGAWLYMKHYPHPCTEQLCARGITLLSILPSLDDERKDEAGGLISSSLAELYARQLTDGNFVYWSGGTEINLWADAMAGHFLTLASNAGYPVDGGVFAAWRNKVRKYVNGYKSSGNEYDDLAAYNLYVLALSGNAQDGAMNRMRESSVLTCTARNFLASAYAVSGKSQVAGSILENSASAGVSAPDYSVSTFFASSLRDDAIALEAQALVGNLTAAFPFASRVADGFAKENYTTQTTAFAASALSHLRELTDKSEMSFRYETSFGDEGANSETVRTVNSLWNRAFAAGSTSVTVTNVSRGVLYAGSSSRREVPAGTEIKAASSGLSLSVVYRDLDGNVISPYSLAQGRDFTAEFTVRNLSAGNLRNLALSAEVPSGWEIYNSRLFYAAGDEPRYSNCDIRDSEVRWYFDLPKNMSKTFSVRLSAAYMGEFRLPSANCEAMYDNSVFARTASAKVKVTAADNSGISR